MADYRAKNRNTKAVDVARIRAAAKFSTPAPKVNPNVVPQKPKDPAKYSAALREQAQRNVTGVRPLPTSDRNKFGIEEVFNPVAGVSGTAGLARTDYNPEGINYGQRTVPTIRGGMVSGGGPGIGSSFAGIGAALYGAATATPITEFDKKRYEKNPFSIRGSNLGLSPEQKREQANDQTDANRKKDYSDLLRTLKAAGLTEEELYRSAVVSPDGKINLNPNAQAIIGGLGSAADSLRLLDVAGLGLGKPVAMGASFAGKQAAKQVRRAVDDVAVRGFPLPVPVSVGGVPIMRVGGSRAAARAEINKANKADYEASLAAEDQIPPGILERMKGTPTYMPPEQAKRLQDEAAAATPKNIDVLVPTQKTESGNWADVEIAGQDQVTGLTTLDPSEIRSLGLGGMGDLVKGTPLESLADLRIPQAATKIRAVYTTPSAKQVLARMNRTDAGVASRPNVKKWDRNTYTIEDAQALLDRWKAVSDAFEKKNGRPLPWQLEADVPNPKTGAIEVKRIFGQDVEHAIPVNQGGTGAADELVLLPSIGNTGKRDSSWAEYSDKNPDGWNSFIEGFYGDIKKF